MNNFTGKYPKDWKAIATACKDQADWHCIRCEKPHEPAAGYCLTVHHFDGDKGNQEWWNLLALCQRCHLSFQSKVDPANPFVFEHSEWLKPYVAGYYARHLANEELCREQVEKRLEELLSLERII